MPSPAKQAFLSQLTEEFGPVSRLGTGNSMFSVRNRVRVYLRYSRIDSRGTTFYGLRQDDLALLEGFRSFVAFIWEGQHEPLLIPYEKLAVALASAMPASDGAYKLHIHHTTEGTDLQVARVGRTGVDAHFGVHALRAATTSSGADDIPAALSHYQVQSILGWIGCRTGHAIHIPSADRSLLDWNLVERFEVSDGLPAAGTLGHCPSLSYIDVLWIHPNTRVLKAAFEVEHSTPIYSGLLRFNDVHLDLKLPRAGIVADNERVDAFYRQIARRTFRASGLDEVCLFYSYRDIYGWYHRLRAGGDAPRGGFF